MPYQPTGGPLDDATNRLEFLAALSEAFPAQSNDPACDAPACDMAWMVPRRHFERFAQQHIMHRDCPLHKQAARGDNKKHVCCTTSEHLLAFARLHRNGTHLVSPSERISISSAASGVLRSVGPLRAVHGICEVVLSHKLDTPVGHLPSGPAGRYVFSQQVRHGLHRRLSDAPADVDAAPR